jgi:hypothetical protein
MKFIKPYLESRTKLLEIFIIAVITTFGLNLITTSIFEILNFKDRESYLLWIGIVLVLFGVIYLLDRLFVKPKIDSSIEGFLLFDKKTKLPVDCEGYEYLEELHKNFIASFSESKAMKHIWKDKSFGHEEKNALIIEASEYFLIHELSMHLTDYFKTRNLYKSQLIKLSRNNIPDILLSNRFLELFSKPLEQRASFVKDTKNGRRKGRATLRMREDGIILSEFDVKGIKNDSKKGRVIWRMGKGSTIFNEFDLVLPKDSEVTRKDDSIQIDTKRFKMTFKFNYDGFGYVLPDWFEELYCGFRKYDDSWTTEIRLDISIEFKYLTLFSKGGWDYYEWIELFLEKMNENFSGDYFLKKINWNQAYTQAIINENIILRKAKTKKL